MDYKFFKSDFRLLVNIDSKYKGPEDNIIPLDSSYPFIFRFWTTDRHNPYICSSTGGENPVLTNCCILDEKKVMCNFDRALLELNPGQLMLEAEFTAHDYDFAGDETNNIRRYYSTNLTLTDKPDLDSEGDHTDIELLIDCLRGEGIDPKEKMGLIYTTKEQNFPEEQKARARNNIDALDAAVAGPIAEALSKLNADIIGLRKLLGDNLGNVLAKSINLETIPNVLGAPLLLVGEGAPTVLPHFVGQEYENKQNGEKYTAIAVTGNASDWQKNTDTGKQDTISDIATIRAKATSAYQKPAGGIPGTDTDFAVVVSEALVSLRKDIEGIRAMFGNLGDTKARCIDMASLPMIGGRSILLQGNGAPSVIPSCLMQHYHDLSTSPVKVYEATRITGSVSDWTLIN